MLPRFHAPSSAAVAEPLPAVRPKTLGHGERSVVPRDAGGALLSSAMQASGVTQRPLAAALGLGHATIAERCQRGGLDMTELAALARRRPRLVLDIAEQLIELVRAVEAGRPMPDPLRATAAVQREAGHLAEVVLDALLDGKIDEAEQRRIEKAESDVEDAARQLRRGPRVP